MSSNISDQLSYMYRKFIGKHFNQIYLGSVGIHTLIDITNKHLCRCGYINLPRNSWQKHIIYLSTFDDRSKKQMERKDNLHGVSIMNLIVTRRLLFLYFRPVYSTSTPHSILRACSESLPLQISQTVSSEQPRTLYRQEANFTKQRWA